MTLDLLITPREERPSSKHWGTYEAFVHDNDDPDKRGRLKVSIPAVTDDAIHPEWADSVGLTMSPGKGYGSLDLPQKGDLVQIEFKDGDPNYPLWKPGWWANDELPDEFKDNYPFVRGFKTKEGHLFTFDDKDGIARIKHKDGHVVEVTKDGVENRHKDGHALTLTQDGVLLKGHDKDVVIDARAGGIKIKCQTKVVIDATNIEIVANATHAAVFAEALDAIADGFQDLAQTLGSPSTNAAINTPVTLPAVIGIIPKLIELVAKLKAPTFRSTKVKLG